MSTPIFSGSTLDQIDGVASLAEAVEEIRVQAVFQEPGEEAASDSFAEQHFLVAVSALETAICHLRLAEMHLRRARADKTKGKDQ